MCIIAAVHKYEISYNLKKVITSDEPTVMGDKKEILIIILVSVKMVGTAKVTRTTTTRGREGVEVFLANWISSRVRRRVV